jgi:hypothetical protein
MAVQAVESSNPESFLDYRAVERVEDGYMVVRTCGNAPVFNDIAASAELSLGNVGILPSGELKVSVTQIGDYESS